MKNQPLGLPPQTPTSPPLAAVTRMSRACVILAVVVAVLFVWCSLGPSYVTGLGPYWQQPSGDVAQGQIGWFYYARDAWRWPLLVVGNYHLPEGGNVLLSDSLPLFAVPTKLLYGWFWPQEAAPPIYLGLWVALCFFLQTVAAARLVWVLGVRRPLPLIAGVALFAYLPMFFFRMVHATLMAHFLILFALTGYIEGKRGHLSRNHWIVLCAIPVISLWITPYLVVMTGLLVSVTILDHWRDGRIGFRGAALRFATMSLSGVVLAAASGLFGIKGQSFADYGTYSLNLLSPFIPAPGTTTAGWLHTAHPSIPGLHQWEGMGYLGAGVMLLCLAALPALRNWRTNLRRHAWLFAMLIGVLAFAVSNRVGFGSREVIHLPLPDAMIELLSNLRGSGRFVWLAVYALIAAAIAAILGRYRPRTAALILVAAAVLQIVDVAPMQAATRQRTATAAQLHIDPTAWRGLIEEHDRLFQFPSFECGGLFGRGVPGERWDELEIHFITAQLNKPINSAYLARNTKDCAREREEAGTGQRQAGTLYLYRSDEETGRWLAEHGEISAGCGYLDDVVICSATRDLSPIDHSTQR